MVEQDQILEENPVNVDLFPELSLNGKQMKYTIEPEIAQEKQLLNDCAQGDQPVFRVEEEDGVTIDLQMS